MAATKFPAVTFASHPPLSEVVSTLPKLFCLLTDVALYFWATVLAKYCDVSVTFTAFSLSLNTPFPQEHFESPVIIIEPSFPDPCQPLPTELRYPECRSASGPQHGVGGAGPQRPAKGDMIAFVAPGVVPNVLQVDGDSSSPRQPQSSAKELTNASSDEDMQIWRCLHEDMQIYRDITIYLQTN